MNSGWLGIRRLRFDDPGTTVSGPDFATPTASQAVVTDVDERLQTAIERTRNVLLDMQHADGYWVGELEGDTILESEYVLLLTFLGRGQSERARQCANEILAKQLPEGGWAIYPGGPVEISASVKAYFALKITGHSAESEPMQRARQAILEAGGVERVNSFTRYYLALLGVISYRQCPAVPPELILIPRWLPFNIYEMSAWSRTILVPLSLLWAYHPVHELPDDWGIRELFVRLPEDLPVCMPPSHTLDELQQPTWIDWEKLFRRLDWLLKCGERLRLTPLRRLAVRRAADWMIRRFERSDGLGAIFPPIIWSVVALKCLGHDDDSPQVQAALQELDKLCIQDGDRVRVQPCKSPVWDTAIATIALRESGLAPSHPAIQRSGRWLLSKEVRRHGDWAVCNRNQPASGWYFEFHNDFYPDTDDTSMVLMALRRCLPSDANWNTDFFVDRWSPHKADEDASAIVAARSESPQQACDDVESATPILNAMCRGIRWILAVQSRDGGWGAFDKDNDRELFTRVPFADHNAMIDPSSVDLTARMLEMFGDLNVPRNHPSVLKAMDYVWNQQEPDACWYGRWGVHYLYGTWQSLVGLARIGISPTDLRIRRAVHWLKQCQQECGGWGETPASYDDPTLRGRGTPTPSQTAWALMGLMAAGEGGSDAVKRGVAYLLDSQQADGTWDEAPFTGTGFPKVFYLKYHLYRIYFPLMALGKYAQLAN